MKNMPAELQLLGLMQGANLPYEKVRDEICPECPYKTGFCEFRMKLYLANPGLKFICLGMRAYVIESN